MTHPALEPYEVFPKTVKQEFAGVSHDDTIFLNFPDEATARTALQEAGLARPEAVPVEWQDESGKTYTDPPKGVKLTPTAWAPTGRWLYDPSVDYMGGNQRELDAKRGNYDPDTKEPIYKNHGGVLVNVLRSAEEIAARKEQELKP